MSDLLHEQLSALVDGELPPEQTTLLLKRLEREPALCQRLARYRICGDVLRGERHPLRADFAQRVSARIAREPVLAVTPVTRARQRMPAWLRSASGLAVAASVGVLAVLVLQRGVPLGLPGQATAELHGAAPTRVAEARLPTRAPDAEPSSYVTPAAHRPALQEIQGATLANYVVAHSEVSGPLVSRSVLIHLLADQPLPESPAR